MISKSRDQTLLDQYNNRFIEKYKRLWQDPMRQDENLVLFFLLALPAGYIADIFKYRLKNKAVPKERSRIRFEHNRPVEINDGFTDYYPGTNMRYLAKTWSVYSIIFYAVLLMVFFAILTKC